MTFPLKTFPSLQWANIVITLERGIGSEKCKANLESYSLPLPGSDKRRGVVVIKSKSKTRARQRKGALTNWKVRILRGCQNHENPRAQSKRVPTTYVLD